MSGRQKIKVFRYNNDGSFIESFDCLNDARNKFYPDTIGKYPMFSKNNDIHVLPDDTLLFKKKRTYRDDIVKLYRIINDKFSNIRIGKYDNTPIECYSLNGDKIAEFKNITIASIILNIPYATIYKRVKIDKMYTKSEDGLIFKFKK